MKTPVSFSFHRGRKSRTSAGFTLPELLIAMTIFIFLVTGILFAHLFGLRMFQITETKLNATSDARQTMAKISDEIRSCTRMSVGNISSNSFVGLLDGEKQQGGALLVYPTTNVSFVLYFVNPSDKTFRRTIGGSNTTILAESVTNTVVFAAKDFFGNTLTNNQSDRVIHLSLEFYQPKRFMQGADYYKLETSVARRALD